MKQVYLTTTTNFRFATEIEVRSLYAPLWYAMRVAKHYLFRET